MPADAALCLPVSVTATPSRPRRFVARHRTALAAGGLVVSVGLALLWLFVVPERAESTSGLQQWLIRFGHSICWALLAVTAGLVLLKAPKRAVDVTAWAALAAYVGFLGATLL